MPIGSTPEGPVSAPERGPNVRKGKRTTSRGLEYRINPGSPLKRVKKSQQHPEAIDSPILPEQDLEQQIALRLFADVQFAQFDRTQWENRTAKWFRQRFGLRDEKTFPWPKASNIHLPLTDAQCRGFLAKLHRLVFGSVPLVSAEGQGPEDQKEIADAELFMDWLCRFRMRDFQKQITIGNSKISEQGFVVFKVIWEKRTRTVREVLNLAHDLPDYLQHVVALLRNQVTEANPVPPDIMQQIAQMGGPEEMAKSMLIEEYELDEENKQDQKKIARIMGELKDPKVEEIRFDYLETIYDAPRVIAIEPKDFVVPGDSTDLQSARIACHRMYMPIEELEERERMGLYKNVSKILPQTGDILSPTRYGTRIYSHDDFESLTIEKKSKEGVQNSPQRSSLREIWEIHFWHRPDPESKLQRWVMVIDRQTKVCLRFVPLPFDHGRLPFIQVAREIVDPRFHSSRGIPEMVEGLQSELNVTLNQQVDRETLINAPWYTYIGNSGFSPRTLRFIPGQGVPVRTHDDIKFPVIVDANKGVWEARRQELKAWAEQYVGAQDFGLRNAQNQGGGQGPRSATEINQIGQLSDLLFGMDAATYSDQFREVFEQIWALWMQFGDDSVWVRVMNKPPRKMTKRELVGRFDFRFTGKADTSNPLLQAQKAQFRLQALLPFSDQPLQATDGKTYMIRKADLIEDYLHKDDPRVAMRILHEMTPDEIQQMQMQQQQAQQDQMMMGLAQQGAKKGLDMTSAVQPPGPQGGMNGRPLPGPMSMGMNQ